MNLNANRALFLAAAVCFAIALLGALGAIQGVAQPDWVDGGLLSVALGLAL